MKVLYFHSEEHLPTDTAVETVAGLLASTADTVILGDLCRLAVDPENKLPALTFSDTWIISPYQPRAVAALLARAGAGPVNIDRIICHRDRCACGVLSQIFEVPIETTDEHRREAERLLQDLTPESDSWRPWFPVIDRQLCTECRQCAGFCLFGVFEMIGNRVHVANPANCKDNCPACARVCPTGAIIFPKYPDGPINGGQNTSGQPTRLDPSELIDEDVMDRLRRRSRNNPGAEAILRQLENKGDCCDSQQDCQC